MCTYVCSNSTYRHFLGKIDEGVLRYMRKLSGKQHQCVACEAIYTVTSNLRAHIETKHYSPGYQCEECAQVFKTRNGYHHHVAHKHGLTCPHCNKDFRARTEYNQHLLDCAYKPY